MYLLVVTNSVPGDLPSCWFPFQH
uniref:Uncharacterized protein n=1 Tax=Anguilla anguilla TaxID=7936 RepID=A0A0E9QHL6_ANGAN